MSSHPDRVRRELGIAGRHVAAARWPEGRRLRRLLRRLDMEIVGSSVLEGFDERLVDEVSRLLEGCGPSPEEKHSLHASLEGLTNNAFVKSQSEAGAGPSESEERVDDRDEDEDGGHEDGGHDVGVADASLEGTDVESVESGHEHAVIDRALTISVASVSIHPPTGTYATEQDIILSCATPQASIKFTTDGSEPSLTSRTFTGPIRVSTPCTIRARSFLAEVGGAPSVAHVDFACGRVVASPSDATVHELPLSVSLSTSQSDAEILYTTDGTEPTEASRRYEAPLALSGSTIVRARARRESWRTSPLSTFNFQVNRAQWEVKEPADPSDGVPHLATASLSSTNGRADMTAASVRGRLHAHRGTWRDDSFALEVAGEWSIIAVADGAGSASLSRLGSAKAVSVATSHLAASLASIHLQDAVDANAPVPRQDESSKLAAAMHEAMLAAIDGIQELALERSMPVEAFATTLLLAVHREWCGRDVVVAVQLGDGAIVGLDEKGLFDLSESDSGAYAGETNFLTSKRAKKSVSQKQPKLSIRSGLVVLAVMTDGVSDDFTPVDLQVPPMFDDVIEALEAGSSRPEALAAWLGYERAGSSDDRTLVVLTKTS